MILRTQNIFYPTYKQLYSDQSGHHLYVGQHCMIPLITSYLASSSSFSARGPELTIGISGTIISVFTKIFSIYLKTRIIGYFNQ